MQKCFMLHKRAKRWMHVYVWQHTGLNCKAEVLSLGAGLGQAVAEADLGPDMCQIVNGT